MGKKFFGVDIQKVVGDNIGPSVRPALLTKVTPGTRSTTDRTAGTNPTTSSHTCRGFRDSLSRYRGATLVKEARNMVSIIGGSLPAGIEPAVGDMVTVDGVEYSILRVSSDPADAVYQCQTT